MKLTLQTPTQVLLEGIEVDEVNAPGCKGQLGMFADHANYVSELETGVVKWRIPGATEMKTAMVSWGFVQVKDQHVSILADVSELGSEIDKGRAQEAFDTAKKKLEEGGLELEDFEKYELKLKRAMARIDA